MKKLYFLFGLALVLAGCGGETQPVYETVGQIQYEPVSVPEPAPISVWVPENAVQTVAQTGDTLYTWDDYELRVQTLDSGNIHSTVESITGMDYDRLTVMQYRQADLTHYETVWSANSGEEVRLGRSMIADDGQYHYCISLISPEKADSAELYAQICGSFSLNGAGAEK